MIPVFSVLIFSTLLFVSAFAATDNKASIDTSPVTVQQLKEYNAKTDSAFSKEINGQLPQYILETSLEDIPVYITDSSVPDSDVTAATMQNFVNGARKSAKDDLKLNKSTQSYEFIDIEEETTYIYQNSVKESCIIITPSQEGIPLTSTKSNIKTSSYGTVYAMPDGIGGKAVTFSGSAAPFSAIVTSSNINYAGSVPDNGPPADVRKINFFNYLGIVSASAEGDLGMMWSNTYQGWRAYFRLTQNGVTYMYDTPVTPTLITGSDTLSYLYKATPNYPTTMSVDKSYNYNGSTKIKLTVTGTRTNLRAGTTSIVAGTGISASIQYKVLTTIANNNSEDYIKKGARIDSTYSSVKVGTSAVTSYQSVLRDNTTIF